MALTTILLLTGCASGEDVEAQPDAHVTAEQPGSERSATGLLESAAGDQLKLLLPDGSTRIFEVRVKDRERLNVWHLGSHAGVSDAVFRIEYETVDGKDYVLNVTETPTVPTASPT